MPNNESAISRESFFNSFEILRLLEVSKGISLDIKFCCYGNQNENNYLLFKSKRLLFSQNEKLYHQFFFKKMILPAVTIKLYCFKLFLKNTFFLNNRSFVV